MRGWGVKGVPTPGRVSSETKKKERERERDQKRKGKIHKGNSTEEFNRRIHKAEERSSKLKDRLF